MSMTSAKNILASFNILDQKEDKKRRHAKNEFQAYAYKLAHDLNDLVHLKIYMMLAKNVERNLMERAYSFVIDSTSNDKGKLFLWKLRRLREENERRRNKENYSYDYVISTMKGFRNKIAKQIVENSNIEFNNEVKEVFKIFFDDKVNKKTKILLVGNTSTKLLQYLDGTEARVTVIDVSKELTAITKSKIQNPRSKIMTKDFLKNSFKEFYYDFIIIHNFWHIVPVDSEIKYLKEIKKILKPGGRILVNTKHVSRDKEEWKPFVLNKEELCFFVKTSTKTAIKERFSSFDFKFEKGFNVEGCEYFILSS